MSSTASSVPFSPSILNTSGMVLNPETTVAGFSKMTVTKLRTLVLYFRKELPQFAVTHGAVLITMKYLRTNGTELDKITKKPRTIYSLSSLASSGHSNHPNTFGTFTIT
jgi:hypothetical protein